jgi:hypothetical protein
MSEAHTVRVAHASRVLVSASRRNSLFLKLSRPQQVGIERKVRGREDALAIQNLRFNDQ